MRIAVSIFLLIVQWITPQHISTVFNIALYMIFRSFEIQVFMYVFFNAT